MAKWDEYDVVIEQTNSHTIRVRAQSPRHAKAQAWGVYKGARESLKYDISYDPEPVIRNAYLVRSKDG